MIPLAEILRPTSLDNYIGQQHLVGEGAVLRTLIESGRIPSMIFWGAPGIGKTTLAMVISQTLNRPFHTLSAISSGVKEVREVIERAKKDRFFLSLMPLHLSMRFNISNPLVRAILSGISRGLLRFS